MNSDLGHDNRARRILYCIRFYLALMAGGGFWVFCVSAALRDPELNGFARATVVLMATLLSYLLVYIVASDWFARALICFLLFLGLAWILDY